MRDVRSLLWLRWRQSKDTMIYWLRVLGYQPKDRSFSQNLYVLYLILIGLFWFYTVGAFAYESAAGIGGMLGRDAVGVLVVLVSWLIFAGQVWVISNALRSTPLKLSFPDMAWIAAAPIRRSAPVIVGFGKQVAIRIFLIGMASVLLAIVVVRPLDATNYGAAAWRALAVVVPLAAITWGVGWALGLLRLIDPRIGRIRYLWVVPVLLVLAAYYYPDPFLWMGRGALLFVIGAAPAWWIPLLVVLALALAALVAALGERINMIHAADESVLYARIQALGLMAWREPQLQARIIRQSQQVKRKPLFRLPKAYGVWTFVARAALSYVRHPGMLVMSFAWGAAMAYVAVDTIINQRPAQVWILWVVLAGLVPPAGLLYVFQADRSEPFLRQFLPVNGLELLIADILAPLLALIAGAGLGMALLGLDAPNFALGLTFVPLAAILIALAGAVALTTTRVLQMRLLATGAAFGAVILAGVGLGTPLAAMGAAFLAALVMAGMVAQDA
jgi:hypothetical protein